MNVWAQSLQRFWVAVGLLVALFLILAAAGVLNP